METAVRNVTASNLRCSEIWLHVSGCAMDAHQSENHGEWMSHASGCAMDEQRRKINQAMLIISSCLEPTGPFMGISCNQTCTADPHDSEAPGSSRMQAWTNEEANLVPTGILLTLRRIRSGHGHASAYRRHRLTAAHCSKYTAQSVWISFWNTLMAATKLLPQLCSSSTPLKWWLLVLKPVLKSPCQ